MDLGTSNYGTGTWTIVPPTTAGGVWQIVAGTDVYMITRAADGSLQVTRPTIEAVTVAASIAAGVGGIGVAVSGAGAVAQNVVLTKTNAYIDGSKITGATNVDLDAAGTSSVVALIAAVSAAIGIGAGGGVGVSIGISIAQNLIGANPDGTTDAAEIQAYVHDSSISADGALTADAVGAESISALVVAMSAAIAGGAAGVAGSAAGVSSVNRIVTYIKAYVDGDGADGIDVGSISLHATDASAIAAIAGAASVAAAIGAFAGISISIAVALARNQVENQVEASIKNANTGVTTETGGLVLGATEARASTRSPLRPPLPRA